MAGELYTTIRAITGRLYKWNGTNARIQVAAQPGAETWINSIVVFNGEIYSETFITGVFLKWNGYNAWVQVASKFGEEGCIR